jgi:hypothetical protein
MPTPKPHKRTAQKSKGFVSPKPGRLAHEIWSREQWIALAYHLHNGNAVCVYVLGWFGPDRKNGGRPGAIYAKSANCPVSRAIPWAWTSLCGKGLKKLAFVPYSQNHCAHSRWSGVDLDAHEPKKAKTARKRAFAFFNAVRKLEGLYVILEATGRGWHVWLISKEFRPCHEWTKLLLAKIAECNIPVSECEIFPAEATAANPFGKGMRAPGCWNPTTGTQNQIISENVTPLLDSLLPLNIGVVPLKEKNDSFSSSLSLPESLYPRLVPCLSDFAIVKPRTRREVLKTLCGHLFHQVARCMAERFAREQFAQKQCTTDADNAKHLKEFSDFWAGLDSDWRKKLTPGESSALDCLVTETERDAFRIIRSYAKYAGTRNEDDFAIVRADLAARLGITGRGAGELIDRFCNERRVIHRTHEYIPHKFAARYRWIADSKKSRNRACK